MSNSEEHKPIGRVVATERHPTTTSEVRFWMTPGTQLKPYDFVRLTPATNGTLDMGVYYAKILSIEEISDEGSALTGFTSADFGQADIQPRVARIVTVSARATVIYNDQGKEMPVPHNYEVHWPEEEGVKVALGLKEFKRSIPCGYITMSGPNNNEISIPISMNADYVIGPEGAHLNISGISGLATKTSYATFLLSSIQQSQENYEPMDKAAFVILNVKKDDLLRVDQLVEGTEWEGKEWINCGLERRTLNNVVYFYPYSDIQQYGYATTYMDSVELNDVANDGRAFRYYFNWQETRENLSILLEDIDDPQQTMVSCAGECKDMFDENATWADVRDGLTGKMEAGQKQVGGITVQSWRKFFRLINHRTKENKVFTEKVTDSKMRKQVEFRRILDHIGPGKVVVIDIAALPDFLQSFVVGSLTDLLRQSKGGILSEQDDDGDGARKIDETVIIFADELNKFAPSKRGERTILRHLREVSERGRSEGVVLFGAEQFRSQVDDRVTGNCSTHIFGRTHEAEISKDSELKTLPESGFRVARLSKGQLIAKHTPFSTPGVRIKFPKPCYRQKK